MKMKFYIVALGVLAGSFVTQTDAAQPQIAKQFGIQTKNLTLNFEVGDDGRLYQRAIGATIYLDGGNRIVYQPRNSLAGLWRQYVGYGKGRSRTMRRHPGSIRLRQLAVPFNSVACLACLLFGFAEAVQIRLQGVSLWGGQPIPVLISGTYSRAISTESWLPSSQSRM